MTKAISSLFLLISLLVIMGCKEEPKTLETVKTSKYDEFVRNPVTFDGDIDSSQIAQLTFDELVFDFDTVNEGTIVEHIFSFKNTGKSPAIISEATSTCGCTVPEWPKDPIGVGSSGEIKVKFNTTNKPGRQDKPVTIFANTLPNRSVVRVKGYVNQKSN
jgi:hypothetical protein